MGIIASFLIVFRSSGSGRLLALCAASVTLIFLQVGATWAESAPKSLEKWPQCREQDALQKISFVHIADLHANYNPQEDGTSPVSRVRGYYEAVKRDNPFTVFTNSGDDYEKGSLAEELSRGRATREVVKALRFDVRTLGNHDFAWGMKELLLFSDDPHGVVLSTNTQINRDLNGPLRHIPAGFTDFAVLPVGCLKIGFFGLTARPYGPDGRQHDGPIYPELPALQMDFDFLGIAARTIARYRQEVDLLVLVSHMGLADDITVAERTSGIDLILGGHSHTIMEKPLRVKDTTIVHVGAHAEHIGRYDLQYDLRQKAVTRDEFRLVANGAGQLPGDPRTDTAVAAILQPYQGQMQDMVAEVRGKPEPAAMARIAARAAVEKLPVDAAFVTVDSVWQPWRPGHLTRQDILDAFRVEREPVGTPGTSSLYSMEVTGADLLHARTVLRDAAAYWGPAEINVLRLYTLALQKGPALNQNQLFSRNISLAPPQPAAELWEVIAALADDLKERNLALDDTDDTHGEEIIALTARQRRHPAL